jgi:hypothetical protein
VSKWDEFVRREEGLMGRSLSDDEKASLRKTAAGAGALMTDEFAEFRRAVHDNLPIPIRRFWDWWTGKEGRSE